MSIRYNREEKRRSSDQPYDSESDRKVVSAKCRCLTAQGKQCTRNVAGSSQFCKQHNLCQNEVGKADPVRAGQQASERLKRRQP